MRRGWILTRIALAALLLSACGCSWRPTPPAPAVVGEAVYVPRQTTAIRYASLSGVKADGTTDNTALVQAILDAYGAAGSPLEFVFDQRGVPVFDGTLYLWSNQTLRGIGGASIRKAGYPASNGWALVSNKHPTVTGTAPADASIAIRDLYLDGNRRGGANGVPGGGSTPFLNPSHYVVPTIGFYGVAHFELSGVQVYDSAAYGFHFANSVDGVVVGCSKLSAGDSYGGDDCLHWNGGCSDIRVSGFNGSANDDCWSFCANDGNDQANPSATFAPGTVAQGPIARCSIRDASFVAASAAGGQFGRFLSSNPASSIADILISGVNGPGGYNAIHLDNFDVGLGNGSYDNITIEDSTVAIGATTSPSPIPGLIYADRAAIGRLAIRNCVIRPSASVSPSAAMTFTASSTVTYLAAADVGLDDPSGYLSAPVALLAGTVGTAEFRGLRTGRGTQATAARPAIECTGTVDRLLMAGGRVDRLANAVNVTAGTTSALIATGVSHTNAAGGKTFTSTAPGVLTTLDSAAIDTALLGP